MHKHTYTHTHDITCNSMGNSRVQALELAVDQPLACTYACLRLIHECLMWVLQDDCMLVTSAYVCVMRITQPPKKKKDNRAAYELNFFDDKATS
jgi:hypothetical protein